MSIFKAYDIRGIYQETIDEEIVYKIGRAYVLKFKPSKVTVGRDVRISSPSLFKALVKGITDQGCDVVDIGIVTTPMMYFSVWNYGYEGGLMVSASHNPSEYNGVKMVQKDAVPIGGDTGIYEIEKMIELAKEVKASEVYLTMIDPIDGETNSLLLNKKQQDTLKKNFEIIYEKYKKGDYGNLKIDNPENFLRRISNKKVTSGRYDSNIIYKIPCTVGWTFSRIMANGDVAPCCRGVDVTTGNINKQRFKEIWNEKKQKMFRKIGVNLKKHPKFVEKVGCLKTCDNLMENKENSELVKLL